MKQINKRMNALFEMLEKHDFSSASTVLDVYSNNDIITLLEEHIFKISFYAHHIRIFQTLTSARAVHAM
jgi:hypothetical protein